MRAAKDAKEAVEKTMAVTERPGAVDKSKEHVIVTIVRTTPADSVRVASSVEDISGDPEANPALGVPG
jgi:hypothetical protein